MRGSPIVVEPRLQRRKKFINIFSFRTQPYVRFRSALCVSCIQGAEDTESLHTHTHINMYVIHMYEYIYRYGMYEWLNSLR